MRARTVMIMFIALAMVYALVRHPDVMLVPAFLVGIYILLRPRQSWLRGRR
ncbi:hypothetical protein ACIRRA_30680 [Nocardia sp. NPDC101769]|uniref:hypothetical protein n=1 Tax=Nocardia sp. NPDC101769 TaxID=3364333 RepID=UPI003813B4D8